MMETLLIISLFGLLIYISGTAVYRHNSFRHFVILKKSQDGKTFKVMLKNKHKKSKAFPYDVRTISKKEIIKTIQDHQAVFFTYSKSTNKYTLVYPVGDFLTTIMDGAKDNNIHNLEIFQDGR